MKTVAIDPQIQKLGELPGLLVNGLLGAFGIGDIFPDFTQTPAWKSLAGGLSAFKGPIQGLVEGKLGIQQPGWRPGMPVPEPAPDPVMCNPKAVAVSRSLSDTWKPEVRLSTAELT